MASAEETTKRGEGEKGVSDPSISLPKGGGAIRGMGEKFAANPVTGTGSMSVPIATSPGRGGFGPQLSLAYDSGAGNGPFGFGWSLSLPAEDGKWMPRADAFSTCRAGFEVRTYRLCQRVLMFHHFPTQNATDVDAAAVGQNCLVRATEFSHEQTPIATYLVAATQAAFRRNGAGYTRRTLPPLQFEYSKAQIQAELKTVDAASIENLPYGIDGTHYQFVDLYGEGISGVLTQQAEGWFYKRNLSPLTLQTVHDTNGKDRIAIDARFAPLEQVALHPSPGNLNGGQQLMDLDGDGRTDLVQFAPPLAGYSAQDSAGAWQPFVPFRCQPNLDWHNPNLRHVELTGDGHADLLITRDLGFEWYRSLDKDGFEPALVVPQPLDDEQGPRLVFADGTQSIYLADMNGDGLTDLVRIRNGTVCYWPSLGYGQFGAKVTMSHAPLFDHPDQFDHQRIRIADIDGSGVADILYIGRDAIQVYRNESGNSWANVDLITAFPRVDNLASVQAMDLLGNGTACLVWSSPLSRDARQPMRYLDLLGGQKPHLLVKTINNLGAETTVQYAPSTKFYLQDQLDGKPWITKLPFPVHVVEKVTVTDKWRKTVFASNYSYHHGYFDGNEREFRGFGRVEQVDSESFGEFAPGNIASPYITAEQTLYQPPVKTITWFHTRAFLDRKQILSQFQKEYFAPRSVDFHENDLPQPDLASLGLSTDEWREALRACKGMPLRQEVYELDVDALDAGQHHPVKLFSTAFHNCHIQRLQPRATNRHAVFLVTESEAITYTYELDLRAATLTPDPRIAHTLNLKVDEFGNVQQAAAAVYPRIGRHVDASLPNGAEVLIAQVQAEMHLAYTETRYTNDVPNPNNTDPDNYRLRVPCEALTYELTGFRAPSDPHYFTFSELHSFQLSPL